MSQMMFRNRKCFLLKPLQLFKRNVGCPVFMNVATRRALYLALAGLESQPLFLCIEDTMDSRFRKKKPGIKFVLC